MLYPNLRYERILEKRGYRYIAGIDEVGRGALAGPVVAGCVVFRLNIKEIYTGIRIDDSKRLSPNMRNIADIWIRGNTLTWGIGEATSHDIDKLGIVKATYMAMRKAVGDANRRLHDRIQYILIDAFYIPYVRGIRMPVKNRRKVKNIKNIKDGYGNQTAIVKGDQKSLSIAAASIIAKVYRDNLMIKLGRRKKYKIYRWGKNKGYGTITHRLVMKNRGLSDFHRKTFAKYG